MTTTDPSLSTLDMPLVSNRIAPRSMSEVLLQRPSYQPSPQTRQARLQQLTTQLLWRLQQSSPFHSSSNVELVLPVLPEATPRLGVPERPAKLLPGLEESQGALYEIGVADDGALVGLVNDELEESLNNLRAMAASLGCIVDILRKVPVGTCQWIEAVDEDHSDAKIHQDDLYVAEVLVCPDSRAAPDIVLAETIASYAGADYTKNRAPVQGVSNPSVQQLRVAFVGASIAGKSSLVGTLTTSILDNGRGKSRLSLLKHRHEIASGVTSSVAQELVGYKLSPGADSFVVNYASGDVSSWTDIHNLADRLCFLTDSPGLPRYAKSTFRAIISWEPRWTVFCIAANDCEAETIAKPASATDFPDLDLSTAYLDLCLRLRLPLMVAVTKMDVATKGGLRIVLAKVLSMIKAAGRKPFLLSTPSMPIPAFALDSKEALPDLQRVSAAEANEVDKAVASIREEGNDIVPLLMTSAVTGSAIGKLHTLLQKLPTASIVKESSADSSTLFWIDEVFSIPPSRVYSADSEKQPGSSGVVLCGYLEAGKVSVGDIMALGPFLSEDPTKAAAMTRSKSCTSQDLQKACRGLTVDNSYQDIPRLNSVTSAIKKDQFIHVRVMSIRNLRLPVLDMRQDGTGTIGIELIDHAYHALLQKARKGMILSAELPERSASYSFAASFPSTDFASTGSPPLILGGHAIAYINSVRAAVKVTAVALAEDDATQPSSPIEMFAFDDADQEATMEIESKEIKITFRFVSTIEWVERDEQVLVVPTMSAAGPVAGPSVATTGLAGFVGRIVEVAD